ncbi:capsid cement protein [Nonomuraea sp. NPDC049655]|uniref:capsid cement protein n=1 Tax=Nonomuraea sp. NPDC049655 TaxID=3364355 RepID=UPI0037933EF4
MATNQVYNHGDQFDVVCSEPATPSSGDPVLVGQLPGVALTDENADGTTTVKFNGVYDFPVKGETTTNAAIAVGDILYYDAAATPHKLNKDNTNGVRFGYALEAVSSGATNTIRVKIGY